MISMVNHESTSPKMLMDCVQFAAVIWADTHTERWGQKFQPWSLWGETDTPCVAVSAHQSAEAGGGLMAGQEDQLSSSSTLLERREKSLPADKYLSPPPACPSQFASFQPVSFSSSIPEILSPTPVSLLRRSRNMQTRRHIWVCVCAGLITGEQVHAQKESTLEVCCQEH